MSAAQVPPAEIGSAHDLGFLDFPDRLAAIRCAKDLARKASVWAGQCPTEIIDPKTVYQRLPKCELVFAKLNPEGVSFRDRDWVSGVTQISPERSIRTTVERRDRPTRRRFTIAHEAAHLFLSLPLLGSSGQAVSPDAKGTGEDSARDEEAFVRTPNDRPASDQAYFAQEGLRAEYFADLFAHYFLMPDEVILPMVRAGIPVDEVAERLRVSVETAWNREFYMGLELKAAELEAA
ncbi:MAG: ImmA/IrrE family metallo-endopeptidase [Bifidobacteriaceae bacterium]|jgi:hypothetical protein|nr:ImmA/IrrE family metallo-endopeptidase [Bifidobacteriaceae bacterium]